MPPPCLHLRSKEMFYRPPAGAPSEHDRAVRETYGFHDNRSWWCQCTQTARGPDDRPANEKACSSPDRTCYADVKTLA